jgi:4-hydroxy-4-methyl-2-oxoglutarate aldolase
VSSASLRDRLDAVDTTSLSDADKSLRVLPAELRIVNPDTALSGRAFTVQADDDLAPVLAGLAAAGPGDVLVVAGGRGRALAGELFGTEARRRGLAGVVLDAPCRDSRTLARLDLAVFARGTCPRAAGRGAPVDAAAVTGRPVSIGGVEVRPGDWLRGDRDGVVVASEAELLAALDTAEEIQRREAAVLTALTGGRSLFDLLD